MDTRARIYEGSDEEQIISWLQDVLQIEIEGENLHEKLKSGVILCELLKALSPNSQIKISKSKMPFPQVVVIIIETRHFNARKSMSLMYLGFLT